eukprot:TRINITY_DN1100_c0_g1_i1.p1 TRINITY_DN1100_c0_g1~~TRINITY_DN1100_c0_g1_i1.p1  ORF type:complete len:196 (-),score=24.43 TRINITY_DN1100_c0_g1_i1:489-1076(-)
MVRVQSGGGVLCIAALQLIVGLCLLGIYEGFKSRYWQDVQKSLQSQTADLNESAVSTYVQRTAIISTPLDFLFYLAIVNNVFSVFGLVGVLNQQREMVMAFFAYNALQMVVAFHYFVDVCADIGVSFPSEKKGVSLTGIEQAAAAFLFFNFFLSICATVFAVKAMDEIKLKQRDEYNRLSVLNSDTLQFESDDKP